MSDYSALTDDELSAIANKDVHDSFSDDELQQIASGPKQTSPGRSVTPNLLTAGIGAAAAGAGAAFAKPWFANLPLNKQLDALRKEYGLAKGTSPEFVAKRVKEATKAQLKEAQIQAKAQFTQAKAAAQAKVDASIGDTAQHLKANYSEWEKAGYVNYGHGLSEIEGMIADSGKGIPSTGYVNEVIDRTMRYAEKRGYLEKDIAPLKALSQQLGANEDFSTLTLTQAKGYLTSLGNEGSLSDNLLRVMRENWGTYLEKVAPAKAASSLKLLNEAYQPFAQTRNALSRVVDQSTGAADTSRLVGYIKSKINNPVNTGLETMVKTLSEGNPLAPAMPGIKEKFASLQAAKQEHAAIKMPEAKASAIPDVDQLVNRIGVNSGKIGGRIGAVKTAVKWATIGKFLGGHLLNVAPTALQAADIARDPSAAPFNQLGIPIEKMPVPPGMSQNSAQDYNTAILMNVISHGGRPPGI